MQAVGSPQEQSKSVGEVVAARRWSDPSPDCFEGSARALVEGGFDLLDASSRQLARGTPVYVQASAEVGAVQRRMSQHHIRSVPVLEDGILIGCVDLVELALLTEPLAPPA
jgi:CBS domain-containing protein